MEGRKSIAGLWSRWDAALPLSVLCAGCWMITWKDSMLEKLNCLFIKRTIKRDASTVASILTVCTWTVFQANFCLLQSVLLSPSFMPVANLSFEQLLLYLLCKHFFLAGWGQGFLTGILPNPLQLIRPPILSQLMGDLFPSSCCLHSVLLVSYCFFMLLIYLVSSDSSTSDWWLMAKALSMSSCFWPWPPLTCVQLQLRLSSFAIALCGYLMAGLRPPSLWAVASVLSSFVVAGCLLILVLS